jgi:hypothetical protein
VDAEDIDTIVIYMIPTRPAAGPKVMKSNVVFDPPTFVFDYMKNSN